MEQLIEKRLTVNAEKHHRCIVGLKEIITLVGFRCYVLIVIMVGILMAVFVLTRHKSYMKKPTKLIRFAKEIDLDPPWVKVEDFAKLKLKRPVVLVNGTFDIFHTGHAKILHHAAKHSKTIVVAMDSDAMVAGRKPGRPIQSWVERAVAFRFSPCDFLVEIKNDEEFMQLVELLKPDLRVRGAEYRDKPSRIPEVPTLFVHDYGCRTSKLIERIRNSDPRTK
jgi:cytidyltransferase-like protein